MGFQFPGGDAGENIPFSTASYSTDSDKLASNPAPGTVAIITDEGNRIEQYLGPITEGGASNQANWLVLRNTVQLIVTNVSGTFYINDVYCGGGIDTAVGWVNPDAVSISASAPYHITLFTGRINIGDVFTPTEYAIPDSPSVFAITFLPTTTPRGTATLSLRVDGD